jgi:CheY-like chemotaxis protein
MPDRLVLLVEDDPADVRLIQRAFGKLKQAVALSRLTNGDDAVAYLSGTGPFENRAAYPVPYVLLLDIKLPRRSGFEVLDWIRKQKTPLRRLPVVMLTSSKHSADVNRAYDLGANSYLAKPETLAGLDDLASQFEKYWLSLNEPPELHGGLGMAAR